MLCINLDQLNFVLALQFLKAELVLLVPLGLLHGHFFSFSFGIVLDFAEEFANSRINNFILLKLNEHGGI